MIETARLVQQLIDFNEHLHRRLGEAAEKACDLRLRTVFAARAAQADRNGIALRALLDIPPARHRDNVRGAVEVGERPLHTAVTAADDLQLLGDMERTQRLARALYANALPQLEPGTPLRAEVEEQYLDVLNLLVQLSDMQMRFRLAAA